MQRERGACQKGGIMLNFLKNGEVSITGPQMISEETWKKIAGAAVLSGYGVRSTEDAKAICFGLVKEAENGVCIFPEDIAEKLRVMYGFKKEKDPYNTENVAAAAEHHFGITHNMQLAGYLDVNGKFLNFSGDGRVRDRDHREINEVLDKLGLLPEKRGYSDGLILFMDMGNIRLMSNGADLSVCPNRLQWEPMLRFLAGCRCDKIYIDLSVKGRGSQIACLEYSKYELASLKEDLSLFFLTGMIPEKNLIKSLI